MTPSWVGESLLESLECQVGTMEIEDARGYHAELRVPILILKLLDKSEMPISSHTCDIVSCYSIPSAFFAGRASYLTKVEKESEIVLIQILCIYIYICSMHILLVSRAVPKRSN